MDNSMTKQQTSQRAGKKRGFRPVTLLRNLFFVALGALVLIYILLPFYWMIKSSFQTNIDIRAVPPQWLPKSLGFSAYERATIIIPVFLYLKNSLIVSSVTAVVSTAVAATAAYVLARYRFPGATWILIIILFTQLVPAITRLFPIYFLIQDLNLLNTHVGLIFTYLGFSIPYAVLLLRGFFKSSIPPELEEAAVLDGCSLFGAFTRVVLPISLPGITAVSVFTFLGAWNDFLWANILLNRGNLKTIQVGLAGFSGELGGVQNMNAYMAACVMATIPAMLLFFMVQRYMVGGLSAGAIK